MEAIKLDMLKAEITATGVTITKLCEAIGMSRETFYHKMNGDSEFLPSQIKSMCEFLGWDSEKRDAIFF